MEGAEPLPRRLLSVLPKLTTASPLITKRAQHPKNTQKRLFRQNEELSGFGQLLLFYEQYNVYFAALKVSAGLLRSPSQSKIATRFAKGSPWMEPSFTWMDQDPRGPWTRCSTRPCLPLQTRETVRQANGLRDVDWTFGKFLLFRIKIAIRTDACWKSESLFPFSAGLFRQIVLFCYL